MKIAQFLSEIRDLCGQHSRDSILYSKADIANLYNQLGGTTPRADVGSHASTVATTAIPSLPQIA